MFCEAIQPEYETPSRRHLLSAQCSDTRRIDKATLYH